MNDKPLREHLGLDNDSDEAALYSCLKIPVFYESKLIQNKITLALTLIENMSLSSLNQVDDYGNTFMHEVVLNDELASVTAKLIEKDKQLLFKANLALRYPIHLAILNGQKQNVELMLQVAGVSDLNDGNGRNALHYSAYYGDSEMLTLCCHFTQSLNSRDKEGKTPLMQAAIAGNNGLMDVLLEAGADPTLKSLNGMTAKDYAKKAKT